MSSIARRANTQLATIWRAGAKDEYGRFTWSAPVQVLASYRLGGAEEYNDATGIKFMHKSTYWTELLTTGGDFLAPLNVGDKIQLGTVTGNPTASADSIRVAQIDGAEMFGLTEKPDYMVMT